MTAAGAPAVEAAAGIPGVVDLVAGFGQGAATVAFTRELAPTGSRDADPPALHHRLGRLDLVGAGPAHG